MTDIWERIIQERLNQKDQKEDIWQRIIRERTLQRRPSGDGLAREDEERDPVKRILQRRLGTTESKPKLPVVYALTPEEEKEREGQIKLGQKRPLGSQVLKGLKETTGFAEAPMALATGVSGWLGGLLAAPTKMVYDAWRSGGRDVSFSSAEKAMQDVMEFVAYKPETELGQMLSEVAASPFTQYLTLMEKGIEKVTDNEEKQAALRIIGNYALLLLPKLVKGGKSLLSKRLKGNMVTGKDLKTISKEGPEALKKAVDRIPDEMDLAVKSMKVEGKIEAGKLAYGMDLPEKIGNIRIDKINSSYEVKNTLADIAGRVKTETAEYRKPVAWAETEKFAQELGMTADKLMKVKRGETFNAAEMEAARRLQGASIVEVNKAMKAYSEDPSSANLINFRTSLERAGLIVKNVSGLKTEAGRALNILRKEYEPGEFRHRVMERIIRQFGGEEKNIEIFEKMTALDWNNKAEITKFIRDITDAKLSDKIFEVWINALLSGIPTQVRNIASNTLNLLTKPIETGIAAAVEAPRRLVGKEPRVYFGEVPYEIFGIFNGLPEGFRKGLFAWTHEVAEGGVSKLEVGRPKAIKGIKGRGLRIPGRALVAADEFFKAIVYSSDLHGMAYRRAAGKSLSPTSMIDRIAELIRNPDKAMMEHATGEMLYRTFQKELGKWGKAAQRFRESIEPVRWIIPFMRVSINIPKYAFERTPFNLPRVLYKAVRGHYKGAEFAENVSRPLIGSLASIGIFIEAMKGNITGSGPTDRNKRKALYRQGWLPYSIKIGDKYYSYAGIEPLATIFGVTADMKEVWKEIEEGERDNLASKLILAFTENITNKTFMRGVSEALNAISDPERHGGHWLQTFGGTVVPTGIAYVARAKDPYFREVRSLLDQIKSRIPGLSETLPPRRDIYGEPIERKGGFMEKMISPVWVSEEETNEVDQELNRLDYYPGTPTRKIRGVELKPEEYNEFSEAAGKNTYSLLSKLIKSEDYHKLSEDNKLSAIKKAIALARDLAGLQFIILNSIKKEKK